MVHPGPSASYMQGSDPLLPLTKSTGLDPFWTGQKLTRHVVQLLSHCTISPPPIVQAPMPPLCRVFVYDETRMVSKRPVLMLLECFFVEVLHCRIVLVCNCLHHPYSNCSERVSMDRFN